jgi:hypothetical protein
MESYDISNSSEEDEEFYELDDEPICHICGIYCPGDTDDICTVHEQNNEFCDMMYHHYRDTEYWQLVKNVVQESMRDTQNDIFLIDILEDYINHNKINFYLIDIVEYRYKGEIYHIPKYESQFLIENLKINSQKVPSFDYEKDISTATFRIQIY